MKVYKTIDIELESISDGVDRKVLAYDKNLMIVEVHFKADAIGAEHSHIHEQIAYIKSGMFEFIIEGESVLVTEGDTIYFPPKQKHGTKCIESGIILDVFTPMRDDFVTC